MKLIKLTCPNCKSNLEVDKDTKEFTCKYCHTKSILDEEILKIEISDKEQEENLKIARTYIEDFQDYDKAYEIYSRLTKRYPYIPEVWIGLVISITDNFSVFIDNKDKPELEDAMDKYLKIEKNEEFRESYLKQYQQYQEQCIKQARTKMATIVTIVVLVMLIYIGFIYLICQ